MTEVGRLQWGVEMSQPGEGCDESELNRCLRGSNRRWIDSATSRQSSSLSDSLRRYIVPRPGECRHSPGRTGSYRQELGTNSAALLLNRFAAARRSAVSVDETDRRWPDWPQRPSAGRRQLSVGGWREREYPGGRRAGAVNVDEEIESLDQSIAA